MKTPEDEAFDDLAKRQGDWGGGYQAKRQMAADKLQEPKAFNFLTMTDKELIETASKQVQALRMALDMIECEKYERRHVRWAIVDALKEAALAQQAQGPVAFITNGGKGELWWKRSVDEDGIPNSKDIPLYTAPPQREWVGLTEDEWSNLKCKSVEDVWIALTVQAKLKEKNT